MSYPSNELTLWSFLRFSALQTSHGLRLHLAVNVCVFFVSLRFVSVVFLLQSSGHGPGLWLELSIRLLSLPGIRPWAGPRPPPLPHSWS